MRTEEVRIVEKAGKVWRVFLWVVGMLSVAALVVLIMGALNGCGAGGQAFPAVQGSPVAKAVSVRAAAEEMTDGIYLPDDASRRNIVPVPDAAPLPKIVPVPKVDVPELACLFSDFREKVQDVRFDYEMGRKSRETSAAVAERKAQKAANKKLRRIQSRFESRAGVTAAEAAEILGIGGKK